MSRINTTPKGLQDLLGNTAAGDNPSTFLDEVRGTIDLEKYWFADKVKSVTQSGNSSSTYFTLFQPVPNGQIWVPLNISMIGTSQAIGESFRLAVATRSRGGSPINWRASVDVTSTIAIESFITAFTFPQVELLTSGEQFSGHVLKNGPGLSRTFELIVRYVLLRE